MALATAEAIRDRIIALIEAFSPTSHSADKFRASRNEYGADFADWCERNPSAAWRRFQVREVGDDETPETTSGIEERVRVQYEITVAYPQGHRAGPANALDRDDVINQDWLKINYAIGIYGRGSFSSSHDCTPLGAAKTRETGQKIDFLVVRASFEYVRALT